MNLKKIALGAAVLISVSASCFALETGVYTRTDGDKVYRVTVLSHEGYFKDIVQPDRIEFIALQNSSNECYASILLPTGKKSYATTSGLVTRDEDEQSRLITGYLEGVRIGYERMGTKAGDFAVQDLGQGRIKVEYAVGYVRGFGFDGVYQREETYPAAPPGLVLHALEAVGKRTGYLAIDNIKYEYRVLSRANGFGYKIQAYQPGASQPAEFEVDPVLQDFNFYWNAKPINIFRTIGEARG